MKTPETMNYGLSATIAWSMKGMEVGKSVRGEPMII